MEQRAAALLREARETAGLTQRALAQRSGVSQPHISAYENGHREPSVPTLSRLIEATGNRLVLALEAHSEMRKPPLSDDFSLELGRLTAARLLADPQSVREVARQNLERMREVHADGSADDWLDRWERLLDGPTPTIVAVLTTDDESSRQLRQNTPFAGVVSDRERQALIQKLRSSPDQEHSRQPKQFSKA